MNPHSRNPNKGAMLASGACLGLVLSALSAAANSTPGVVARRPCADVQLSDPLDGISVIVIDAGPSELRVVGAPDRTSLDVTASLCHSDAKPSLQTRREGNALHLSAGRSDGGRRFLIGPSTSLLVSVSVPHDAQIEISEIVGPTSLRRVSAVAVRGGVGTLTIADIQGDVHARTRTGAMSIVQITGNTDVANGAGQLLLSDIHGDVTVAEDGAGQITINAVRGNVLIESDDSGEIRIARTTGDVLIKHDGSGAIIAHDIGGTFTVDDKTRGSIVHNEVRGEVRIPPLKKLKRRGPR